MVVSDTVHLVGEVHGKGNAVQAFVANDASEAAGVVGLPQGLQDLGVQKEEARTQQGL